MRKRSNGLRFLLIGTAMMVAGCNSTDQNAAAAASQAEAALSQGQPQLAQRYIRLALAERDDVGEYWLIAAHIAVALGDNITAFDAYRNVLATDRGNQEALSALCQLALIRNTPGEAAQYADQLALLQPADLLPPTVKAAMAMARGDTTKALQAVDNILKQQPNYVPGLILKSKVLISQGKHGDAAQTLEESLRAPGNPDARLFALMDLYRRALDRPNYRRTVVRVAEARPEDPSRQLAYADLLYDEGQNDAAYAITRRQMTARPTDIGLAAAILNLWLKYSNTVPIDQVGRDAAGLSPVMRAAYAQYASEQRRPDLALTILGPAVLEGEPNQANSDAKAAYAYAIGLRGDRDTASKQLDAILKVDPTQPRALVARARLSTDVSSAVQDARRVVTDDASNMVARLTLANLLMRENDSVLAESTLRAGLKGNNGDTRALVPLLRMLRAQGRQESANTVLTDFSRDYPFSLHAARLRSGQS